MKISNCLIPVIFIISAPAALAQISSAGKTTIYPEPPQNSIETISREVARISQSLDQLNSRLKTFSETFSSNQGLRLSERQQKLLAAFEFLNRAEQRLAVLQKTNVEFLEKQSAVRQRLARNEENLRAENIDRNVAVQGTTNAEELRAIRRQVLLKEKNELNLLLNEIQKTLDETALEIRQTEFFLKNIRHRIFPEIEKELLDL